MFISTAETRKRAKYAGIGWRMTRGSVIMSYREQYVTVPKSRRGVAADLFADALSAISQHKFALVKAGDLKGRGAMSIVASNDVNKAR